MAYKTCYKLNINNEKNDIKNVTEEDIEAIEDIILNKDEMSWALSEGFGTWGENDRSWETREEDMKDLSLKYPYLIFKLEYNPIRGYSMGLVKEYWYNGKCQKEHATILFNKFDESKLKEV